MVNSTAREEPNDSLTWEEAIAILDKNFNFRTKDSYNQGPYSYRMEPNGPSLEVSHENNEITLRILKNQASSGFKYQRSPWGKAVIETKKALIDSIKEFKNIVVIPELEKPIPLNLKEIETSMHMPLNTILYGPPGTGKTYKTAELAVQICDGTVPERRSDTMARYEELRGEGRINFVTFHQSYGYEDFVEGLKPESIDGQITYPVRPGVFRKICEAARRNTRVKPGLSGKPLEERKTYKISLGRNGTTEGNRCFQTCIENEYILLGWGDHVDFSECHTPEQIKAKLLQDHPNDKENPDSQTHYVNVFKNELKTGDLVVVSQGNSLFCAIGEVINEYEYLKEPAAGRYHQMRRVRWLAIFEKYRDVDEIFDRKFMQAALYKLDHKGLKLSVLRTLINGQETTKAKNFVLIIDEINRANISKVFGELITLLEPDKREQEENALTVKLPYSGDDFSVPSNLHIVGTMNTADRSIALLDTALRRRFEFEELQPAYIELSRAEIENINLGKLLYALNERIEYLYDRDHTIGHAYFISIRSLTDLDAVMRRKVLPLLQEYFYEDWSKVRLVLNDREGLFIESKNEVPRGLDSGIEGFEPRPRYKVKSEAFPVNAYLNIYQ
jgi:5-methylcytosine-specific restriction protein B